MFKVWIVMWKGYYENADLIFIKAITNLHVGTGKGGETVDLPIQRDSFGFPMIYSSSLKGAIKSYIYHKYNNEIAEMLLGPDEAGDFASPVSITDAYLLAFPARSLKGVYCYLTCPFLLKRFKEYLGIVNKGQDLQQIIDKIVGSVTGDKGISDDSKDLYIDANNIVINEELIIPVEDNNAVSELKKRLPDIDKELVVINDDDCLMQATRSMIRLTRVRLNRSTKTVDEGPWTEEYIPPKTLLFSIIFSKSALKDIPEYIRMKLEKKNAEYKQKVYEKIQEIQRSGYSMFLKNNLDVLIIGGHETIGSGLVKFYFW
jgi:CRISPR-associated protein Cmr4